ncbi:transposase [Cupriavidus sp. SK-3]|nr:transposase [Cupriavidus sp. SK-3]
MRKIPKQEFTAEFKEQAVRQLRAGKTTGELAAELGVSDQTLRNWRKAAEAGKLNGAGAKPVTAAQMEQSRLRAENRRLAMELEIAKKAAAHFTTRDLL